VLADLLMGASGPPCLSLGESQRSQRFSPCVIPSFSSHHHKRLEMFAFALPTFSRAQRIGVAAAASILTLGGMVLLAATLITKISILPPPFNLTLSHHT
jgi:hypothetical protein